MKKICSKCGEEKLVEEFNLRKCSKDGFNGRCKSCMAKVSAQYYQDNRDKILSDNRQYYCDNKDEILSKRNIYYCDNKDSILSKNSKYYQENREKVNKQMHEYYLNNREKIIQANMDYIRKRLAIDPIFKLSHNIRSLISHSFKDRGFKKNTKTRAILGIDIAAFKQHLEDSFIQNYGRPYDSTIDEVHIDHIIPLSSSSSEEDIIKLCRYTNLQLLLAKDNMRKGDKLDYNYDTIIDNSINEVNYV